MKLLSQHYEDQHETGLAYCSGTVWETWLNTNHKMDITFSVTSQVLKCISLESGKSYLEVNGQKYTIS